MSDKMPELPLPVGDVLVFDPIHQMTRLEQAHGEYFTEYQLHAYARQYAQQWREDAERYRWIRSLSGSCDAEVCVNFNLGFDWQEAHGHELDAAIDAARAAREGGDV